MNEKIDLSRYEGHTEGPWESEEWAEGKILGPISERHRNNHPVVAVVGHGWWGDMMPECNANLRLMTDAPLLLAEVKRLQKLEAALVGSWMETINRGSDWHKQLRDPCVELGYLTYADHRYELSEEYQDMAKQWVREWYGDEEEGNHEHMTVKCKWCSKEIQVPFEEPPNKYGYGCWECLDKE